MVRFNWDMYLKASLVLTVVFWVPWPGQLGFWALLAALGAAYFLVSSLVASHLIYDLSDLYRWQWFHRRFYKPERIVNIHSGFDETTEQLTAIYPDCQVVALDFFDQAIMTEPSIARARAAYPESRSHPVSYHDLKLEDRTEELVTCLLAAHELREHSQRVDFFREVLRVLKVDGRLVLLEHLRDVPNFLAFGPGFVHFFSYQDWHEALSEAGFRTEEEFSITPFIKGFVCRKESDKRSVTKG